MSEFTVDFSATGVTVIEGDNEVGKTCIPEALDLILSELDSSGKKKVREIRPVHRDEGPEVEVELSTGKYRFIYSKRWHRKPETRLEVTEPQREQLTGREAHERVEAILEETLDYELWQALRVEQSAPLILPDFAGSSLGQALDHAAGGDTAGNREDSLWDRICREKDRYWTSTGRTSLERKSLNKEVEDARRGIVNLEERLLAVENDAEEVARLADEEHDLAESRDQFSREERELSALWASAEKLRTEVNRLEAAFQAADVERDRVVEARKRRQALIGLLGTRRGELDDLQKTAEQSAPSLALINRRYEEARTALSAARDSLRTAEEELRQAEGDRDHHQRLIDKELLSERLERVMTAQEELKAAETVPRLLPGG